MGGVNFSSNSTFPSISGNGARRCLHIIIDNNNALEKNPDYPVNLTVSDPNVVVERGQTILTIIDDDGMS